MLNYKLIFLKLITLILFNIGIGGIINPIEGDTLNYRQIAIEWEQQPSAIGYNLRLYKNYNSPELVLNVMDSSLAYIVDETIIEWDEDYKLYVRTLLNDGSFSQSVDSITFNTYSMPFNYSNSYVEANSFIDSGYQLGITLLQKTAIDKYGENIFFWNSSYIDNDGMNFTYSNLLDNGNMIGWIKTSDESIIDAGVEIDLDGDIYWSSSEPVHHDLFTMPNGNYMGLVKEVFYAPPPDGPWVEEFEEYGITTMEWLGDKIVEWDPNGNIVWSWNTSDYISLEEFDPAWIEGGHTDNIIFGIEGFDWTHSNAVFYDEIDNAVYLSVRHLSRIIKIDYETGDIIWNMGKEFLPGVINFGQNLNFSYQHAIRVLDNRNLMLYDNGNQNNPQLSRCIELELNENESSAEIVWEYVLPDSIFTASMGECDRLENGNTLITAGRGNYLLEVDNQNNPIWELNTEDPFYRSDRVPNLYPLLFSIEIPNFSIEDSIREVFLPLGNSYFDLTINNDGHLDFDFTYVISEDLNWYENTGTISVPANNSHTIQIPIAINEVAFNNTTYITVCPISDHNVDCKTILLNANVCETNPNYYFSDMSSCPELIYGDINQDMIVDILDIIIMIDIIMGNIVAEEYMVLLADINQDNIVDIMDIISIINIILS